MKPLRPVKQREKSIQARIRRVLEKSGCLVRKSHGNRFQAGWPDLLVLHPETGCRWVEVKRPSVGKLTPAQRVEFEKWEAAGARIWILTSADEIDLLEQPPNWRDWL